MTATTLLGIFVGGASSRMGGMPKGLLPVSEGGEPIVARLLCLATELSIEAVFVGEASPYAMRWPAVRCIADRPAGTGPLGGLAGVLCAAGDAPVLAVACDMPYVSAALLQRLLTQAPSAMVLASRTRDGCWDPLCARYEARLVAPRLARALGSGVRSFQRFFETLPMAELELDDAERGQLVDWDAPDDVSR